MYAFYAAPARHRSHRGAFPTPNSGRSGGAAERRSRNGQDQDVPGIDYSYRYL